MSHPHDRSANLVDILVQRAERSGGDLAFRFLADGEADEQELTYAEVVERAGRVATTLREAGCGGGRAILVYQPGLDYITGFLGCLMAGVAAVPAYPP